LVEGCHIAIGNERLAKRMGWKSEVPTEEWASSGGSVLWIGSGKELQAQCSVADAPRQEAKEVVASLKDAGMELIMLTGDMKATAEAIGKLVDITDVRAGLMPDDKISHIMHMRSNHKDEVAMVGDGINDVPALAAARIGIAMGAAGRASALEVADVVLMDSDLKKLVMAFRLGKRVLRKIKQNIAFAVISKLALVLCTVAGKASLWGAICADVGAMLVVTLNGTSVMSLRRVWKRQAAPPSMMPRTTCTASCCALAPEGQGPPGLPADADGPPLPPVDPAAFCASFGGNSSSGAARRAQRRGQLQNSIAERGENDSEKGPKSDIPAVQIGNTAL